MKATFGRYSLGDLHMILPCNKTDSAVRAVHIPTGTRAIARDERSQARNKASALRRLGEILGALAAEKAEDGKRTVRLAHHKLERGGERRAYEGEGFHRIF